MPFFYRTVKFFTLALCLTVGSLIIISYMNALGCQFTVKHLIHTDKVNIFSTCNSGIITTRVTTKTKPFTTTLEMKSRMFTLFNHQMAYITSWNKQELKHTLDSPFFITFNNSFFLHSSISRFSNDMIGIHIDNPINLSHLGEIEGYLSLQDRFNRK